MNCILLWYAPCHTLNTLSPSFSNRPFCTSRYRSTGHRNHLCSDYSFRAFPFCHENFSLVIYDQDPAPLQIQVTQRDWIVPENLIPCLYYKWSWPKNDNSVLLKHARFQNLFLFHIGTKPKTFCIFSRNGIVSKHFIFRSKGFKPSFFLEVTMSPLTLRNLPIRTEISPWNVSMKKMCI